MSHAWWSKEDDERVSKIVAELKQLQEFSSTFNKVHSLMNTFRRFCDLVRDVTLRGL